MPNCSVCGYAVTDNELRLSTCWECAEAESIISEGLDMFDCGMVGIKKKDQAKTSMDKLKFLIKKGWKFSPKNRQK
jgi:hypothetical protein